MKRCIYYWSAFVLAIIFLAVASTPANAGHNKPPWDHQRNNPGRFKVLSDFNDEAVLDKETGLVWEKLAGDTDGDGDVDLDDVLSWFGALSHCYNKDVGGRKGWRLPTVEELASLVDITQGPPTLPADHPFEQVQSSFYWSATTRADLTSSARGVDFLGGAVGSSSKGGTLFVWCVRGGQGHDGQ